MSIFEKRTFGNVCKYGLIVMNSICFVCGLILIGAGIFLLVYKSDLLTYVYSMPLARPAAIIIITCGSAVLIPSFFGLIGAVKENKVLLIIYASIMALVCLLSAVGAILAIATRNPWNGFDFIRQKMRESLQKVYGVDVNTSDYNAFITAMWDQAQQNWYCCGAEDASWGIYRQSTWYEMQPGEKENDRAMVPPSCCVKDQYGNYVNLQKCQTWQSGPPKLASGPTMNEALFYNTNAEKFCLSYFGECENGGATKKCRLFQCPNGCYVYGSALLQRVSSGIIAMGIVFAVLVGLAALFSIGLVCYLFRTNSGPKPVQQPNFAMYNSKSPGVWNSGQSYT